MNITGYNQLSGKDKQLFGKFLVNYLKANPEITLVFRAVKRTKNGTLRVDLLKNNKVTWQEIFSSTTWG